MLSRHWDAVGFWAHCRHYRDGDRAGWQSHLCRCVISEAVRAGNDLLQAAILGMQAVGFPFPDGCSVQDGVGSTVQQAAALRKDLEREPLAILEMTDEQAKRREVQRDLDILEGTSRLGADLAFLKARVLDADLCILEYPTGADSVLVSTHDGEFQISSSDSMITISVNLHDIRVPVVAVLVISSVTFNT